MKTTTMETKMTTAPTDTVTAAREVVAMAMDEGMNAVEIRQMFIKAIDAETESRRQAAAAAIYGERTEHRTTVTFAPPEIREDGKTYQQEIATCSCGWATAPMSHWDARKAAASHEAQI